MVPGSLGSYSWSGLWGTYFWIDPAENMIGVRMIQVTANKVSQFSAALRNLSYGALRVEAPPLEASALPGAAALSDYTGRYHFGLSSSARDRNGPVPGSFAGTGLDVELIEGGAKILLARADGPAAKAGVRNDDLITQIDDTPLGGLSIEQVIGRLRGAAGSEVRLKVARAGQVGPLHFTIIRAPVIIPGVELEIRIEGGKLLAEATGRWPVLDFELGKPVVLAPASPEEFYVSGEDHTRLAFVRDTQGRISGAVLNPGPWQLNGMRSDGR
jgi:hypothetical protein